MTYLSDDQVRRYRILYAQGDISFLGIREDLDVPKSTLEQILRGDTRAAAGGPLTTSFRGVAMRFPEEQEKDDAWRREYMKKYRHEKAARQKKMALALLGGKCVKCGTDENLQFDHIDPSTKRFHILQQITGNWAEIEKEIRKCQLLCYACHKGKSAAETTERNAIIFSGERSVRAKLTDAQAAEYRERFVAGGLTMHAIAAGTGMATKNVRMMLRGLTYRHAGGPLATADEAINYITPERKQWYKEEVVRLFKSGITRPEDISKRIPISAHTAKSYLVEAGLLKQGQNLKIIPVNSKLTHDQVRKYRERFAQGGLTMTTIAQEIGMSIQGVSRFLKGKCYASAGGPLLG